MKFKTTKQTLKSALSIIGKAVTAKLDSEYSFITIEYTNGKIKFSAFNGNMYIEKTIKSNMTFVDESDQTFKVRGKLLIDIINKIADDDEIELCYQKGKFVIYYSGGDIKLPIVEADGENAMGDISPSIECLYVNSDDFISLAKKTVPFVDTGDSRPILKGVNLTISENSLIGVGCDGYRISKIVIDAETHNVDKGFNITLPAESLSALSTIAAESEYIKLSLAGNRGIICENNGILVMARALSGAYVDTNRIFPKIFKHKVKVSVDKLKEATDKALLFVSEKAPVEFTSSGNKLIIVANSELGAIKEQIEIENAHNGKFEIYFNGKYLSEILKCVDCEYLTWSLNETLQPAVLSNESETETYLILPIRKED